METRDLNPYVRFCHIVTHYEEKAITVHAYDHRLFYLLENTCTVSVEGTEYTLLPGEALFVPPTEEYSISESAGPCRMILLNFDLDPSFYGTPSLPPDKPKRYRAEQRFSRSLMAPLDRPLHLKNGYPLQEELMRMVSLSEDEPYLNDVRSARMKLVLLSALSLAADRGRPDVINRVREYLDKEYLSGPTNRDVAKLFGYHPYYLNELFRRHFGQTIHAYVTGKKLDRACALLLSGNDSIAAVAEAAGFCSAAFLAEQFRARYGLSPTQFRQLRR